MTENELSFLLTAAAVLIAALILLYGLYRLNQMMRDLAKLRESLETSQAILGDIHTPQDLFLEFEERHSQFSAVPTIGPRWSAFRRSIVQSEHEMLSPTPAASTFNYELLYSPAVHLRRHEAVPNQLVGIGLLFTFLGLALSLAIASSGLQGDVESAKTSLIALMSASAIKFVTSIAAILAALVFTHFKNAKVAEIHVLIDELAERIDWLVPAISAESKAEEICGLLRVQNIYLEERNEELAKTIASELDATLQTSLKDALQPVAEEIGEMADKMGEISENTMRHMVEMFSKELGSAARDHSKRMADLLEAVSHAVEKVPEKIELSSSAFSAAMEASAHKIEDTFGQSSRSLMEVLRETSDVMSTSAAGWSEVSASLTKLTDEISGTQDAFGKRLDAVHDATDRTIGQIQQIAAEMKKASDNLPAMDQVSEKLERASEALDRSVQEIGKLEGISDDARTRALEAARHFAESVTTIETEMKQLDKSMAAVFAKTSEGLAGFKKQTDAITGNMDKQLGQAVDRLALTVERYAARSEAAE